MTDRPVLDHPPLAADLSPTLPHPIHLLAGPRAWASSADPSYLPPKGPSAGEAPSLTTDPTAELSCRLAITGAMPLRDQPAPPLNLATPDPFAMARAVQLRQPLPEIDWPANSTQRPPLPPLPVK
jgi:hypothetical protein